MEVHYFSLCNMLCELKFCCVIEIRKMRVETIKIFVKIFN